MSDSGEYYRITCRFCDTIITVTEKQAGTEVKCPDCFSMLDVGELAEKRKSKPVGRGGKAYEPAKDEQDGDELKLSETFERPAISPLFGLDASSEDMLAPRKNKPVGDAEAQPDSSEDAQPKKTKSSRARSSPPTESKPRRKSVVDDDQNSGVDVDDPLPVDDVLSLEKIGNLVTDSEPDADAEKAQATVKRSGRATSSVEVKRKKRRSPREASAPQEPVDRRPEFKPASLFMATVGMLSDIRVIAASVVAVLIMLIGGFSSEAIFPTGSSTESLTITESMYKYFTSFLFGCVPYYIGLLGLWTVAAFVFRDAVLGHDKFQGWSAGGQGSLWATILLFSFSFFIAGLPGAIFQILIIPLRMLVAPLFLLSAWFNSSPWQIISADWYHIVSDYKSQWLTVYGCFGALAFGGVLVGSVFFARSFTELVAVDLILTAVGIGMNALITLVFAAVAGWHAGAVVESLGQD